MFLTIKFKAKCRILLSKIDLFWRIWTVALCHTCCAFVLNCRNLDREAAETSETCSSPERNIEQRRRTAFFPHSYREKRFDLWPVKTCRVTGSALRCSTGWLWPRGYWSVCALPVRSLVMPLWCLCWRRTATSATCVTLSQIPTAMWPSQVRRSAV